MQPVDRLIAAVLTEDPERVDALLARDPGLGLARNMFGVSAVDAVHCTGSGHLFPALVPPDDELDVFLAAELGRVDVVRAVIRDQPEQILRPNDVGTTALHGACYWGRYDVAASLLEAGADVDARDTFLGIAPLGTAVATTPGVPQPSDSEDVVLRLVRLLLEHGADVDLSRADGMTALHAAAWRGLDRVVQELLDAGADRALTATDGPHRGQTPADAALSQGHLILADRLDSGTAEAAPPYG